MNATAALADLQRFGKPVFTTGDAVARLRMSSPAASRMLGRLAGAGLLRRLRHGLWTLQPDIDPLLLPEHLTAPFPAYVSFQTALYLHGMISQIPRVIYVASLGKTRRITTAVGTYSMHHLAPEFFGGHAVTPAGVRLATLEKALLDVLYLAPARSRLFASLPEVELPESFDEREARRWVGRIPFRSRRTAVARRLSALLRPPVG